jgi:hypothetical protein
MNTGTTIGARVRPAVIPGEILGAAFSSIPDVLWKLLAAGWISHIPITYFVDEFIDNVDEHHRLDEAYHLNPNGRWTRTGGDQLPDRNERGIQTVQWIRGWQRFLGALASISHPDTDRWRRHVQLILNQPTMTSEWPLWVLYDITLRRRSLREGVDPSVLQTDILAALRPEYERARANAYISSEIARLSPMPDAIRARTSSGSATANPPRATQAAHTSQPQAQNANTRTRGATNRCFLCTSTDHLALACTATTAPGGGKLLAERTSPTAEWTVNGKPFCYKFNGTKGCNMKSCSNPHVCSICGSTGHCAQNCRK